MADLLNDYYKKLQTINQQRSMTGNQSFNQGIDASLAEGYFDAQQKNRQAQEQLDLQKNTQTGYLDLAKQNQSWQQAYSDKALSQQSSSQTTNLIGQAIGGAASLATNLYGINKRWGDKTTAPESQAITGDISGFGQPDSPITNFSGDTPQFQVDQSLTGSPSVDISTNTDITPLDSFSLFTNPETNISSTSIYNDMFSWW